jgi:triosephosphate isomerase (TIM)
LKRPFIINFKNYAEVSGEKSIALAKTIQSVSKNHGIEIVLAPPQPCLALVTQNVTLPVICQHLDVGEFGQTTGFFIAEMAKSYGAQGSLINHSEHKLPAETVANLVQILRRLDMISIVCAQTVEEVAMLAEFSPDFIAIEPPELIGSGKAVSKENPTIITNSISAAEDHSRTTKVICGAGITDKSDVAAAIDLGAEGILVSSGVIKAQSWYDKISELVGPMSID